MNPATTIVIAFAALTIVAIVTVAVLAALRTDPTRPRLSYELFLRLTGLAVFCALAGVLGSVAGFAFLLGGAS